MVGIEGEEGNGSLPSLLPTIHPSINTINKKDFMKTTINYVDLSGKEKQGKACLDIASYLGNPRNIRKAEAGYCIQRPYLGNVQRGFNLLSPCSLGLRVIQS